MTDARRTLFGLVAKTKRGRERLRHSLGGVLPKTFPRAASAWWIEPEHGVALYAPVFAHHHAARRGQAAALAIVGVSYAEEGAQIWPSSDDTPPGLTAAGAALFAELKRRQASALAHWSGEFALAFFDGERGSLLLARDPLGQRGLFVRLDADVLLFCSELTPLLADQAFSRELDMESAFHYLACGLPSFGRTLARNIWRVPAGHYATWEADRPLFWQRYFTPLRLDAQRIADDPLRAKIGEALDRAIELRLAKSKTALLLSGGIDSSYIAATAAALGRAPDIDAYTVEFTPSRQPNETPYATLVARMCGIRHHLVPFSTQEALLQLEATLAAAEPCSAWATLTHAHLLTKMSADGHRYLLSGLGADEVFGGYQRFLDFYFLEKGHRERWPVDTLESFDGLLLDEDASSAALFPGVARFFDDADLRRSLHSPYRKWHISAHTTPFYRECRRLKPNAHVFEMMVAHECQHRVPDLLFVDFEMVGRYHGIRTAYPFLDPAVVSLGCGLGPTSRFWYERGWFHKKTLRDVAAARIPLSVLKRAPVSYTAPFALWMQNAGFRRPTLARLRRSRFWKLGLVRREVLRSLEHGLPREQHTTKPSRLPGRLWALLTLSAWYDRWVESEG